MMIVMPLLLAAIAAAPLTPATNEPRDSILVIGRSGPYRTRPVTSAELAIMRGGVDLPNGLSVSLGIDIQTRVDGLLVLHTIYASDGPNIGIRVYTDGAKDVPPPTGAVTVVNPGDPGATSIEVTSGPTGVTITPVSSVASTSVNIVNGPSAVWAGAAGQTEVPVVANGPGVDAAPGTITLRNSDLGAVVTLDTNALEIQHLIGQATGTVIANTGNDRSIDTVSSINVDLRGSNFPAIAGLFAADALAQDIMRGR